MKQTTLNEYTYMDETDGKQYLLRYGLYVDYDKVRDKAIMEVVDTIYHEETVEYHLGEYLNI